MMSRRLRKSFWMWLLLCPLVLVILFPFAVMVLTSFKPADEVFSYPGQLLPKQWQWRNYVDMWQATNFGVALRNSLLVSVASTALSCVLAIPAAYALARWRFHGAQAYRRFLLVTQMLSPIVLVVGLFRLAASVPFGNGTLVDTRLSLVLCYAAFNLAFAIWMLSAYFETIPRDLEEAAWLEGASTTHAILRVFLPLATPAIAVTFIFTFVNAWNEYAVALTMLRSTELKTLTLQVADLVSGRYRVDWHLVMAATFTATLPVAIIFAWLQRYLVKGLAMGAVK